MFCLKLGELKPLPLHQLCHPWSYWVRAHVQKIEKRNQTYIVYNQCVVPLTMYRSKTWTLYRQIERFIQQWDLRSILKIKWDDSIINEWQWTIWLIQQEPPYVTSKLHYKSSLCYLNEGATISEMIPSR